MASAPIALGGCGSGARVASDRYASALRYRIRVRLSRKSGAAAQLRTRRTNEPF
jgi:hypothetical protein